MMIRIAVLILLIAVLIAAIACKQQSSEEKPNTAKSEPPVDLNKPVENPRLVAALGAFEKNQGDDTRRTLWKELKSAVYLIPVRVDKLATTPSDKSGKMTVTEDSPISFFVSADKAGNPFLPIFTDWQEIAKFTKEPVNTIVMPADDLWGFVLNQKSFHGAVLNPGDKKALPLDRTMIQSLKK